MKLGAALPLLSLLAACGSEEPEAAPSPASTVAPDKPRRLIPANLANLELGPEVEGLTTERRFISDGQVLARVRSSVVCPQDVEPCTPAAVPADTLFTYIHSVTPAEGVANAAVFRTVRQAYGFAHGVGFDQEEAVAALGESGQIEVAVDNGALVWRVIGGDGWQGGETITFYWQSRLAPEGLSETYAVEADGEAARGTGPFPPRQPSTASAGEAAGG